MYMRKKIENVYMRKQIYIYIHVYIWENYK